MIFYFDLRHIFWTLEQTFVVDHVKPNFLCSILYSLYTVIYDNQPAGTEVCWAQLIKCHSTVNPLPAENWYLR